MATGSIPTMCALSSLSRAWGTASIGSRPSKPPGQPSAWPATHQRLVLGASVAQILSPRSFVSFGLAATHQHGALSSPYRRAVIVTTLFPEVLPGDRYRYTGFVAASVHVADGRALHLRQGGYAETWGVIGIVPEASIVKELGERVLVALRYRFVERSAASFYQVNYGHRRS